MDNVTNSQHDLAERIRNATAWWNEAARALDQGRYEDAATFAYLGEFGLEDMRARVAGVAGEEVAPAR